MQDTTRPSLGQRFWQRFCRFAVSVFYRRFEIVGADRIPNHGAVMLCANHVNALVDAVVVQAASPRIVHPLARSGLFRRPLLRIILSTIQAVPIYRRPKTEPSEEDPRAAIDTRARNDESFRRLFAYLRQGRTLLIFPEGQSHSDPSLRPIKTGAARIALGAWRDHRRLPTLVPVGLVFTQKGRFRGDVLVQIGEPIALDAAEIAARIDDERALVGEITDAITQGLLRVTLNVESWDDVALLGLVRRFAERVRPRPAVTEADPSTAEPRAARRGSDSASPPVALGPKSSSLAARYADFRRLYETHRLLRVRQPMRVANLRTMLVRFERLCTRYGVSDYHLNLRYRPLVVLRFALRSLAFILFAVPLALWGLVTSGIPYALTRAASRRAARARDQYDTASMLSGFVIFGFFWGIQIVYMWQRFGFRNATVYAISLPVTAAVTLIALRERRRIIENVRVFVLFMRQGKVRDYLRAKRNEIEQEIAHLGKLAREAGR